MLFRSLKERLKGPTSAVPPGVPHISRVLLLADVAEVLARVIEINDVRNPLWIEAQIRREARAFVSIAGDVPIRLLFQSLLRSECRQGTARSDCAIRHFERGASRRGVMYQLRPHGTANRRKETGITGLVGFQL